MLLQQTDIHQLMRSDMERVSSRVAEAARVRYAGVSPFLEEIVQAGGKRLRPLLLLLAARAYQYDENVDTLITAAAGVELLHTASLVHDDTVDRAAIRRGKPTLNSVFDHGSVILIGDYLFAQSAMLAAATGSPRVVSIFASTLGAICDGQLMEMIEATDLDQTDQQYFDRIYGKTASLFAGAAEMGTVISGAPEDHIQALLSFGGDVGLAFQIVDDVLDLTGESSDLGKPAGNDLRQGTITLPVIYYLASNPPGAAGSQMIASIVAGTASDVEITAALDDIRSSGCVEKAFGEVERIVQRAKDRLRILPDITAREGLCEFAEMAIHRAS
ncbi:polyprenyl synthetase family protein [soil metagenome]